MKTPNSVPLAMTAVLILAEIKTALEGFDRGESNAFDVLDAIVVAIEGFRAVATDQRGPANSRPEAA